MNRKKGYLSTKISKGPLIFTIIGRLSSIVVITLIAIFGKGEALAVTAIVFFSIILIAAIALLIGELFDYAYIKDDYLYMVYVFKRSKIKISDIGKIKHENNIYTVFDKNNNKIGTINAIAPGNDQIIIYLDKHGARLTS